MFWDCMTWHGVEEWDKSVKKMAANTVIFLRTSQRRCFRNGERLQHMDLETAICRQDNGLTHTSGLFEQ